MHKSLRAIPVPYRGMALLEGLRLHHAGTNTACCELIAQTGRQFHRALIEVARDSANEWRHRVRALQALSRTGCPLHRDDWDALAPLADDDCQPIRAATIDVLCRLGRTGTLAT